MKEEKTAKEIIEDSLKIIDGLKKETVNEKNILKILKLQEKQILHLAASVKSMQEYTSVLYGLYKAIEEELVKQHDPRKFN